MNSVAVTLLLLLAVSSCTLARLVDSVDELECGEYTIDQPGEYVIVGDKDEAMLSCSVLFLAGLNQNVEISISQAALNCSMKPYFVIMFDGYNQGNNFFPPMSADSAGLKEQFKGVCDGGDSVATYVTATNALTILHNLNNFDGLAMRFSVRFVHNDSPCNVITERAQGMHVLHNSGSSWQNCSLLLLQPAKITLDYLRVGHWRSLDTALTLAAVSPPHHAQTALAALGRRCARTSKDSVQFASFPYKWYASAPVVRLCGDLSYDEDDMLRYVLSSCGPVTVNLQSGGRFRNRVMVSWEAYTDARSDSGSDSSVSSSDCLSLSYSDAVADATQSF